MLLLAGAAFATDLAVQRWGRAEGLGADAVTGLELHGDRLLVHTSAGAQWFDGARFWPAVGGTGSPQPAQGLGDLEWTVDQAGPGLASGIVTSLVEHGRAWLGKRDGLYRIQPAPIEQIAPPGYEGRVDALWRDRMERLWQRVPGVGWWGKKAGWLSITGVPDLDTALLLEPAGEPLWIGADRLYAAADHPVGAVHPVVGAPDLGPVSAAAAFVDGSVWIGGEGWFARYEDGVWAVFTGSATTPVGRVREIRAQPSGTATALDDRDGLLAIRGGVVRRYTTAEGLPSNVINQLWTPREHELVLATADRGVCIPATGELPGPVETADWRCFGADSPIGSDDVRGLLNDGQARLWLCTSDGLRLLHWGALHAAAAGEQGALIVLPVGANFGVRGRVCPGPGGQMHFYGERGELGFPSTAGVMWIRSDEVRWPDDPHPWLAALRADGVDVDPVGYGSLPADTEGVELDFTAPDLGWGPWASLRVTVGDSAPQPLRPGEAVRLASVSTTPTRLLVEAALGKRGWGSPLTLEVARRDRWYETGWARAGAVLAAALTLTAAWLGVNRRQRAREAILQAAVAAQTAELRRQNEQLAEGAAALAAADRLKSEFIANAAHELRTPLMLILNGIEDARRGRGAALDAAHAQAAHLSSIVSSLLDLARIDSSRLRLRARRVDLTGQVRQYVDRLGGEATRRGIRLRVVGPQAALGWLDVELVERIITNLVGNALSFARSAGQVDVGVEVLPEGRCRVTVDDDGPGIPLADRERVFERFVQLDTGAARSREGMGIGLSLSRELAERHGGSLRAGDSPLGGARLVLELPIHAEAYRPDEVDQATASTSTPAWQPPPRAGAPRLLLVEDNPQLRDHLAEQLADVFDVVAVAGADPALAALSGGRFAAVVSDLMMPGVDGAELLRRVSAAPQGAGARRILISAKSRVDLGDAALASADAFIEKPFVVGHLLNVLAELGVLTEVASQTAETEPEPAKQADQLALQKLESLLARHLADPDFGPEQLARAAAMSSRSLHRLLTRATGLPPLRWMRETRLRRARDGLTSGAFANVAEAATAVGMSRSYFYRAYEAAFGAAPQEHARLKG